MRTRRSSRLGAWWGRLGPATQLGWLLGWALVAALVAVGLAHAQVIPGGGVMCTDGGVILGSASMIDCAGATLVNGVCSCPAGGGGGAPTNATYITQTPHAGLSAEQALSLLGSGLMFTTTGTGVVSIYAGETCPGGQFVSAVDGAGDLTCATPAGGGTVTHTAGALTANQLVIGNAADDLKVLGTLGTATTVLHGNAGGAPTFGAVVSGDLNLTATTCTNQFLSALSSTAAGTCTTATLTSAQFANQGTTTTVLHGNAAGNPTFGAVSLTADVSGDLPFSSLAQGAALSVLGVAGNATADVASIAAGTDHQVLRRSGTTLGFGAVNLGQAAAITGDLPFANLTPATGASLLLGRGDAGAGDFQEITLGTNLSITGTTLNAAGGGGGAPTDATYVTLSTNGTLTNERVLTGTTNQISLTDNGAGSTIVLATPQNIHTAATPTFASATLTANTNQLVLGTTNTTTVTMASLGASRIFTLPDANSNPVRPSTCSAGQFVNGVASTGILGCDTPAGGGTVVTTGSPASGNLTQFSGATSITNGNLSGDVTTTNTLVTTIAAGAVTFAKMQDISTDRLIGRDTAATGDPEEISVGGGLEFTGSAGIQRSALTGDVTASAGSNSTTIAANAVTDAKFRQGAATSVVGRSANSTGNVADIAASADGQVLRRAGGTLGFGALDLADTDAVTGDLPLANLVGASAASRVLCRGSAGGAGDWEECTVAAPVTIAGTVISSSFTASSTDALTNKTFDAEGTGNVLKLPMTVWIPAAGCTNTTAGSVHDIPTSNGPAAACYGTSPMRFGGLDHADGANALTSQVSLQIPSDWDSGQAVDLVFVWFSGSTSTNSAVWTAATKCLADTEDLLNPTFNTAQTVADANNATANTRNTASLASLTMTGCAGSETLFLRVGRDPTNGSDTLAATAVLLGVQLTFRRSI